MRVAILSPYPTFPFHERLKCLKPSYENHAIWTMTLADALARLPDTEVHVLTEATNIPASATVEANGLHIHYLRAPRHFKTLTLWQTDRWRLHRRLAELRPDIVHGQGLENQYGYSATVAPFPRVLTIHGISRLSNDARLVKPGSRERIAEFFTDYCLKRVRDVVVVNPFIAEALHLSPENHRLHDIPNAVAPEFFMAEPVAREPDLLLSIGYVERLKAHDILARALVVLKRRGIRLRSIVVGPIINCPHTDALRKFIRQENLDMELVGFLPPDKIRPLLQRSTMLVHPSRIETFGMVVAEAMATSTPVVASRVGGIPHLIQDGESGLLFESENAEQLADKIQVLLENEPLRLRMTENGRRHALSAYAPERIARLTRATYEQVLTSGTVPLKSSRNRESAPSVSSQNPPVDIRSAALGVVRRSEFLTNSARWMLSIVPLKNRLGRDFWRWYEFFEESERWSSDRLAEYQLQQLRVLLGELSRTSEFYRQRLADVDPARLRSIADFQAQVPPLSRAEYRQHFASLVSNRLHEERVVKGQTSGTTGCALQFYQTARDQQRELAAIYHQWKRVGYQAGVSCRAEFRGLTTAGKPVEIFPEQNMIRCSILHLKAEHVRHYATEIRKHGMEFFHGYPSALYLLARQICLNGIDFPQPRAVLFASEAVYDYQVTQIEAAFPKAKIMSHYGCAERTVLGAWCEHRREYHVLPQYSLVEVDPQNSEIIGTNLFNTLNGFVRYRMSDTALAVETTPCPDCGRPYIPRLVQLGGRAEDYLYSPERGWIPPAIVTYALKLLVAIHEVQIVQKEEDALIVRYSVAPGADRSRVQNEREQIGQGLRHLFGPAMQLHFELTDEFPRGPTGKFKWIICELDRLDQAGMMHHGNHVPEKV